MPKVNHRALTSFIKDVFYGYGVPEHTAQTVATSLVLANLTGHDSHGVIRVIDYVKWIDIDWIDPHAEPVVVKDSGPILIIDGNYLFGQVVGRRATEMAIEKAKELGVCVLSIRRSGHLGRIGEFVEMAASAELLCVSLTNTHGGGVLVAPHGGIERRLSANPIAGGGPLPGGSSPEKSKGDAIVVDVSTAVIAEGKIKVARDKGAQLPEGSIVDGKGDPSTDPLVFYSDPGALLPMAGYKGYGISVLAELFAGVLSGAGCSRREPRRVANAWFAVFLDPEFFCDRDFYNREVDNLITWIKSSRLMKGFDEILLPGEPEAQHYQKRIQEGIEIDDATWQKIVELGKIKNVFFKELS